MAVARRREMVSAPSPEESEPRGNVVDVAGSIVRLVLVARNEMTCLECGETTAGKTCMRCSSVADLENEDGEVTGKANANLVPTISYLHPSEWRSA